MTRAGGAGRYAPSPSGRLHIGNLRTGVLAWLLARGSGRMLRWRIEDLDRVQPGAAETQLADFAALGITPDGPLVRQSDRVETYAAVVRDLTSAGLVYECYCSRRDIQAAPSAPHTPPGAYPGTCRHLSAGERAAGRQRLASQGRAPAIRLDARAGAELLGVPVGVAGPEAVAEDVLRGRLQAVVDDVVLRRGDGVHAYHLAVVVDDLAMGIDQVVRGDDLASSTPRQVFLAELLVRASATMRAELAELSGLSDLSELAGRSAQGAQTGAGDRAGTGDGAGAGDRAGAGDDARDAPAEGSTAADGAGAGDDAGDAAAASPIARPVIEWIHVPLVLGPGGERLAKRDGAVTLGELAGTGFDFFAWLGTSLGFGPWQDLGEAAASFDLAAMSTQPVVFDPAAWSMTER